MMKLSEAAGITSGRLHGDDQRFTGVSIDSRTSQMDDLFVAIQGNRLDGNQFVEAAIKRGATGAMVNNLQSLAVSQVEVNDTDTALGQLGADWRRRFNIPVIAITGSNGKTTVTRMITAILSQCGICLSPKGSFNNHWGVPLTLLKLRQCHQYAVLELGMNHAGEISNLTKMVQPTIALINNAADAHLEGLDDVDSVATAKAEIFEGLRENGVAIINADDSFAAYWERCCQNRNVGKIIRFGFSEHADIRAEHVEVDAQGSRFELVIDGKRIIIQLPLVGLHNVANALAAAAISLAAGISMDQINSGLASIQSAAGRLQFKTGINRCTVIDDSYNANPASIIAALKALYKQPGNRIAVLGPMAELGTSSRSLHEQVGSKAAELGIDELMVLATEDPGYGQGFGKSIRLFDSLGDLLTALHPLLAEGSYVLVKGSRAAAMERVVSAITDANELQSTQGALC